jgi:hypothetical protein
MDHCEHEITLECSIDCLRAILSGVAFNPLARASSASFDSPDSVADVVKLVREGKLDGIYGLGPRRIGEIEVALVFAGLVSQVVDEDVGLTDHQRSLCLRNRCGEASELAELFGHDRIAHAMINALVREGGIRTVSRLRATSEVELSGIRGVGPHALATIRARIGETT